MFRWYFVAKIADWIGRCSVPAFFRNASLVVGAANCRVRTVGMQQGMESEKGEMGVLLG